MLDKSDIRFILPHHGWLYKHIKDIGFEIYDPYTGNALFPRILREIHFRLNLPIKSIWYNKVNHVNKKTIFIFESLIIPDYIKWLHNNTKNGRIILFYANPVRVSVDPNLIDDDWCEKWTADILDSKEYNLKLYEGGGYFSKWKVEKETPSMDVFYVGKDKGRLEKTLTLKKQFDELGLNTYFHITAERGFKPKKDKNHKPFMPYEEILKILGKTKAILHLIDGCQKGITMRIAESLIHEIKLVTDDKDIVNYDFYHPNNIFILEVDDISRLPAFLNSSYTHVKSTFYNHPYFEDMVNIIVGVDEGEYR